MRTANSPRRLSSFAILDMADNVFLFLPNLIGYARIILSFLSFYYLRTHPGIGVVIYLLSHYLDDWDGWAARKYNQVTNFGAIMDVVTDKITFIGLLMGMCQMYPSYTLVFQTIMVLEIFAHWLVTHAALLFGSQDHKTFILSDPLAHSYLKLAYGSKVTFQSIWMGSFMFYPFLYLCHFSVGPTALMKLNYFILSAVGLLGYKAGVWVIVTAVSSPFALGFQIVYIL